MKVSCKYCGGIHDRGYVCSSKPVRVKAKTHIDKFRSTYLWTKKSKEIRQRDKHLCQVCIRNIYDTTKQYTFDNLGVHHVYPVHSHWDKRLDNDNLLTVCEMHHKQCETGEIPLYAQLKIVSEQELAAKIC
jgi:5-methylcytosine-specific restriction enzyme A